MFQWFVNARDAIGMAVAAAVETRQSARRLEEQLDEVRRDVRILRHNPGPTRVGSIVVIWTGGDGPGFVSRSFALPNDPEVTVSYDFDFYWPIPKGAWVVAHGCHLTTVRRGMQVMDIGLAPVGSMAQLDETLKLGERLGVSARAFS